jgi:hypothetical protein
MATNQRGGDPEIRLNFKLGDDGNPLLTRDLRRFPKGRARHRRLLTLATIGLMAEETLLRGAVQRPAEENPPRPPAENQEAHLEMLSDARLEAIEGVGPAWCAADHRNQKTGE